MDIPLNVDVHCTDGICGRSVSVIVNPTNEEVTYIVVRDRGDPKAERLVPVGLVKETTPDLILLDYARDKVARLRPFVETEFLKVSLPHCYYSEYMTEPVCQLETKEVRVEHKSISPSELAVRRGAGVEATDGRAGRVGEFVVNPEDGSITHLILRKGQLWGQKEVTIPVSEIDRIEEDTVYLKLDKGGIAALPTVAVRRNWL